MSRVKVILNVTLDDSTGKPDLLAENIVLNIETAIGEGLLTNGGCEAYIVDEWFTETEWHTETSQRINEPE
jgi:hypothetical protein